MNKKLDFDDNEPEFIKIMMRHGNYADDSMRYSFGMDNHLKPREVFYLILIWTFLRIIGVILGITPPVIDFYKPLTSKSVSFSKFILNNGYLPLVMLVILIIFAISYFIASSLKPKVNPKKDTVSLKSKLIFSTLMATILILVVLFIAKFIHTLIYAINY